MRLPFSSPAAFAAGLALCLAATASAQPSFALEDPVLVAAGRTVSVQGAPLAQERFGALVLAVPGVGTYTVSDRPFDGSRLAGQFENQGLYFASEGVSVRLLSNVPILGSGRREAYVRTSRAAEGNGAARVALAVPGRETTRSTTRPSTRTARGLATPASGDRSLRAEIEQLRAEIARLGVQREQAARDSDEIRRGLQASLDRATAERDALRDERDSAIAELDSAIAELDSAIAERRALGTEMERVRRDAERAALQGQSAAAERHRQALDRLRGEIVARDASIAALTTERDERGTLAARLTTELERVNGLLAQARSERDAARTHLAEFRERPAPEAAEVVRLSAEVNRLSDALATARAERDRLAELTSIQTPELASGEAEIDRLQAEMAQVRQLLADTRAQLSASDEARAALQAEADRLRAERGGLAAQPTGDPTEAEAMRAERERLLQQIRALEDEIIALRSGTQPREASVAPSLTLARPTSRATASANGGTSSSATGAAVTFPDFDTSRLANLDAVIEHIAALRLPSDLSGEVLVLFQTDPEGHVIRTALAQRVHPKLDSAATALVESMRFDTPVVDGRPTALRTEVRVRFGQ